MPRTPEELAAEARASLDAGARVLHLHPYDADGRQIAARCVRAMVEPLGEDRPAR